MEPVFGIDMAQKLFSTRHLPLGNLQIRTHAPEQTLEVFGQAAMQPFVKSEIQPGAGAQTDAELDEIADKLVATLGTVLAGL